MAIALGIGGAQAQVSPPLQVQEIGSFHVGGRVVALGDMPKREIIPRRVRHRSRWTPTASSRWNRCTRSTSSWRSRAPVILLLWHGGGLTGVTWETTPDGRPGWQMYFLRQGHDVYVSDAMERGRSGWARFPEIFAGEPVFRSIGEGWDLFRVGPQSGWNPKAAQRRAFADTRFPWRPGTPSHASLCRAGPPRTARSRRPTTNMSRKSAPA
ncbi:hypothetical protein ACFQU7_08235 [Pseudoroseomonas wenyumeiae]